MKPRRSLILLIGLLILHPLYADSTTSSKKKKKKSWLQQLGTTLDNSSNSNKSASVAGVRGLEETKGGTSTTARDYEAIDRLEKVAISDNELKKFLQEGKLE